MSIVRYQAWPTFGRLHNELNRFLDAPAQAATWRPSMDITELEGQFVLKADLPGIDPGDIDITVDRNILTIKGERKAQEKVETDGYTRFERVTGEFTRKFTLPDNVDGDGVSAAGQHGVLTISIPKVSEAQPKKITVAA